MANKVAARATSKKKTAGSTVKKKTSKKSSSKKKTTRKKSGTGSATTAIPASELLNRADQFGAILAKGIDLAEAGLSLGLTLIDRVGSVAQESILDRVPGGAEQPHASEHGPAPDEAADPYPPTASTSDDPGAAPGHDYFIVNRLPLHPGSAATVSFSINNDSLAMPKKVELTVGDFVGETRGARFTEIGFAVKPARKTIAPMDFEKFVLRGMIPQDAITDVYRGSVTVSSEEAFEIPVRLVVTPAPE